MHTLTNSENSRDGDKIQTHPLGTTSCSTREKKKWGTGLGVKKKKRLCPWPQNFAPPTHIVLELIPASSLLKNVTFMTKKYDNAQAWLSSKGSRGPSLKSMVRVQTVFRGLMRWAPLINLLGGREINVSRVIYSPLPWQHCACPRLSLPCQITV